MISSIGFDKNGVLLSHLEDYLKVSDLPFLPAYASDSLVYVANIASSGIVKLDLSSWDFKFFGSKSLLISYSCEGFTGDFAIVLYDSRGYKYLCKLVDSVKGELQKNGYIHSTDGTSGEPEMIKFADAISSSAKTVWCRVVLYRVG